MTSINNPAVKSYCKTGCSHGSGKNYDTHILLLLFGNSINKGQTLTKTMVNQSLKSVLMDSI